MEVYLVFGVIIIIFIFLFFRKDKNQIQTSVPQSIKISELKNILMILQKGDLTDNFFGITTNGDDCLYFVKENGRNYIDYEVISTEQKKYVEELSKFYEKQGLKIVKTTYGNAPSYDETKEAPVYRIEVNSNVEEIEKIAREVYQKVFQIKEDFEFEVVP